MKPLLSLCLMLTIGMFMGCVEGNKNKEGETTTVIEKKKSTTKSGDLVSPCEAVTVDFLQSVILKNNNNMTQKDASGSSKKKTCFYKIPEDSTPNAGIMVSVENYEDILNEVPDFHSRNIKGLKTNGEMLLGSDIKEVFKDFPGFGDDGAYSFRGGKYVWTKDNVTYTIYFNASFTEETQMRVAKSIAKQLMNH